MTKIKNSEYLIFNGYRVENIKYICNDDFKIEEENNIIPRFGFALINSENNTKEYNVIIGFSYTEEHNQPFLMEAVVRGFFELGSKEDKNILYNAFGILFPYVRSLITDMTRYSLVPVVIPTVNIMNEIENLEKIYLDSEKYVSPKKIKK